MIEEPRYIHLLHQVFPRIKASPPPKNLINRNTFGIAATPTLQIGGQLHKQKAAFDFQNDSMPSPIFPTATRPHHHLNSRPSKIEMRKKSYKIVGDATKARSRRLDTLIENWKNKRNDNLLKKRCGNSSVFRFSHLMMLINSKQLS
ncbi:hypothetical protein LIER_39520 [Lithospermum erythrorhizon]|uniref:IBB domain-containing protein n=1 Tax=Lithospermum erythrorhizon TaxID=34254 RepID=A0AAV3QJB9_LITER